MAQFFDDFSGDTPGTLPTNFESMWAPVSNDEVLAAAGGFSGNSFVVRADNFARQAYRFTAPPSAANSEIRTRVNLGSTSNSSSIAQFVLRGGGTPSLRSGYVLWVRSGTNSLSLRTHSLTGSEFSMIDTTLNASHYNASLQSDVLMRTTDQGAGVLVEAWVWPAEASMPTTPTLSVLNTVAPIASGWQAVGSISGSAFSQIFSWLGVGTDGDPAPTAPISTSRRRSPLLLTPW